MTDFALPAAYPYVDKAAAHALLSVDYNALVAAVYDVDGAAGRVRALESVQPLTAVGDGVIDDTVSINLQLAAGAAGSVVRGQPGKTYLISSPIVLRPGGLQTLDMTGCTVTLKTGSSCNMLQNKAVSPTASAADGAISGSSTTLTTALTATVGQAVSVAGAGPNGGTLYATVTGTGTGTLTLSAAATATVSGAAAAAYTRDTGVTVVGGTWNRQGNGGTGTQLHSLVLRRVDGVTVRGLSVSSTAGKYSVNLGDVTNATVADLRFNTFSDGLHVQGPAKGVRVSNLYGTTGDDMFALTGCDFTSYADVYGDITDVVADGLFPQLALAAFKIISGGGTKVARVSVRGIYGTTQIRPVAIIDDLSGATDARDIHISDISCMPPTSTNQQIARLYPSTGRNIVLENVHWEGVLTTTNTGMVQVDQSANIQSLTLRDFHIHGAQASIDILRTTGTVTIGKLIIDGVTALDLPTVSSVVNHGSGCTINNLDLCNVHMLYGSGTTGSLVTGGGSLLRAQIANVYTSGGNGLRMTFSSSTRLYVRLVNVMLDGGGTGGFGVEVNQPADIDFAGGDMSISSTLVHLVGTNATGVVVKGFTRNSRNKAGIAKDGTQAVRVRSLDYEADVSVLTATAGDQAYNTNTGLSCGAGPVICNGTTWKHLYTGATF